MFADHAPNPAVLATSLASLAAVLAVVVGAMVLAGWAFDIVVLKSILPGWVSMKPNAAVCFILIGIALLLTTRPPATFNPERSGRSFSYGNRSVNSAQPKVGCGLPTFSAAYPLRVQRSTFFCRLARLCGAPPVAGHAMPFGYALNAEFSTPHSTGSAFCKVSTI